MKREIYIIFISKTINAMGFLIHPFMTLLLSTKVGLSGGETGMYVALTGMMWAPASIAGGKLSDTVGRKVILVTGELLAAFFYLACFFLEPGISMVYMLMAASFCFGLAGPSHDALTADLTTEDQRAGAYSLNYLGFNLGFAFAQVLAGLLFENYLKYMFLIDGFTALAGLSLIAFLVKAPELPVLKDNVSALEKRKPERSTLSILLGKPVLLVFALTICGYRFVYSQWPFLIPLHLEFNFPAHGARIYGILGSFNALTVVILTPVLTSLLKKSSNVRRIFYAGILFSLGFGMLGFVSVKGAFFLSVFLFTLGEILEAISVMPFIMNHTPATHRGRMSAILPIIMGAGFVTGPVIMGNVLDRTGFQISWMIIGGTALILALVMKIIDAADSRSRSPLQDPR